MAEANASSSGGAPDVPGSTEPLAVPAPPPPATPSSPAEAMPIPPLFSKSSEGSLQDLTAKGGREASSAGNTTATAKQGGKAAAFVQNESKPCGVETFLLLHDRWGWKIQTLTLQSERNL